MNVNINDLPLRSLGNKRRMAGRQKPLCLRWIKATETSVTNDQRLVRTASQRQLGGCSRHCSQSSKILGCIKSTGEILKGLWPHKEIFKFKDVYLVFAAVR